MLGDGRKMMPIGNISSRNFWRVRGQKTTAQVINSGGKAKPAGQPAHPATSLSHNGLPQAWQREEEERFFSMLFFSGYGRRHTAAVWQQQ